MDHRFDSHVLTTPKSDHIFDRNVVVVSVNCTMLLAYLLFPIKWIPIELELYPSILINVLFNCFSQELDNLKAELERMDKIFIEKDAKFVAISKKVST